MEVNEESVGDVYVVTARGRLDANASGPFGQRLQTLISPERPKLLLDFAGIEFVTSAGLRVVLAALKKVKSIKGVFAICGVQEPVREVLEITGLNGMMDIHSERAAALQAMR